MPVIDPLHLELTPRVKSFQILRMGKSGKFECGQKALHKDNEIMGLLPHIIEDSRSQDIEFVFFQKELSDYLYV